MSRMADDGHDGAEVGRLLAGAAETIASVRYCWLVTGTTRLRPMGLLPRDPGESEWTFRFITDRRSRKASDIRRDGKVAILFQRDLDDAYVTLIGTATLHEDAAEIQGRWKRAYDAYFPGERGEAVAAFVEVEAERMELWIRGVTREPFGLQATLLERDAGGAWRVVPGERKAA